MSIRPIGNLPTIVHGILIVSKDIICCLTLTPILPCTNGNHFILTVTCINVQQYRHPEFLRHLPRLDRIDRQYIYFLVFEVQSPLVYFLNWMNVEFIFALHVFNILFHFRKIRRQR